MAWLFHIVERPDGRWACRHGAHEYDAHLILNDAVEHLTAIAWGQRPAEIVVHRLDGPPETVAVLPT